MRGVAAIVCTVVSQLLLVSAVSAAGPLLLDYRTEGTGNPVAWSNSSGVGGRLGSDAEACHHSDPNDDYSRPTSLVVTVEPRDGGFVTLSYRFRSWYPTLGAHNGLANAFRVTLRNPATGAIEQDMVLLEDYSAGWCQPRDTGWVTTSLYIRPWYEYGGATATREIWLTVLGHALGYQQDDPTYRGTSTNLVEIEDLAAVCSGTSTASATAPAWSMRLPEFTDRSPRRPRPGRRIAANAAPVTATCKECCTKPLVPLDPGDADSVEMESGYDAWHWLTRCSQDIQDGTACFRNAVEAAGYRFALTSSLRTAWYQKHLREVWDKYQDLVNDKTPECAVIRQSVITEKNKHGIGFKPAGLNPRHVTGDAIDVSPSKMGLTLEQLDVYADPCGLYRRVPKDKYHYEVKP